MIFDLLYIVSYGLGTVVGITLFLLPIALIIFLIVWLVRRSKKKKQSVQPRVENSSTANHCQEYQYTTENNTAQNKDFLRQQKAQEKQQRKQAKEKARAEKERAKAEARAAKEQERRRAEELRNLEKLKEAELLQKINSLNIQYPLIQKFHGLEFTYNCKSKREYESIDLDIAAIEYLRSHPEELEFYNDVVLPNAKNQIKYERAFKEQIEPYTSKSSILKKKRRKGQIGMSGFVVISYVYKDRITRKRKEDRRVEVFKSLDKVYQDVKNGVVRKEEKERFAKEQRAAMTPSLRYDILQRDGFRCQLCGATQADGAKLHVDHIIPVSKGGKTVPENLRTLCEECNIGKGAKIEDDSAHSNRVVGATIGAIHNNL